MPPEQLPLPLAIPVEPVVPFQRVFKRLRLGAAIPGLRVEFRPFAGLRSTICLRKDQLEVCLSDVLQDAPPLVLEALAEILLCKVYRRRASREARECYLAYVLRPGVRHRIDQARRQRGNKRLLPPRGRWHNLEEIFQRLNQQFFKGELSVSSAGLELAEVAEYAWPLRRRAWHDRHQPSAGLSRRLPSTSSNTWCFMRCFTCGSRWSATGTGAWCIRANFARRSGSFPNSKRLERA